MNQEQLPILRLGRNLLVSLQGDLDDAAVLRLEDQITREIVRVKAEGTLLDVSGLSVVDSFIARVIARIASMVRLLGSETVVVGIQPAVAITLVELGVSMEHVHTALNAGRGMELLGQLRALEQRG
ncbi:MAG: STAS domain-containing protein [Polyangiales bacterium]